MRRSGIRRGCAGAAPVSAPHAGGAWIGCRGQRRPRSLAQPSRPARCGSSQVVRAEPSGSVCGGAVFSRRHGVVEGGRSVPSFRGRIPRRAAPRLHCHGAARRPRLAGTLHDAHPRRARGMVGAARRMVGGQRGRSALDAPAALRRLLGAMHRRLGEGRGRSGDAGGARSLRRGPAVKVRRRPDCLPLRASGHGGSLTGWAPLARGASGHLDDRPAPTDRIAASGTTGRSGRTASGLRVACLAPTLRSDPWPPGCCTSRLVAWQRRQTDVDFGGAAAHLDLPISMVARGRVQFGCAHRAELFLVGLRLPGRPGWRRPF
jgi:hypothetical protein